MAADSIGISLRECLQSYKVAYDAITLVPSDVNSDSGHSLAARFSGRLLTQPMIHSCLVLYSATVFQVVAALFLYVMSTLNTSFLLFGGILIIRIAELPICHTQSCSDKICANEVHTKKKRKPVSNKLIVIQVIPSCKDRLFYFWGQIAKQ